LDEQENWKPEVECEQAMVSLMTAPMEMNLARETEVLKEQIRVSWKAAPQGQHYWMGTVSYRKWTRQVQSVRGLVGSMTSQPMDYIG
jgi:hypothetical protein